MFKCGVLVRILGFGILGSSPWLGFWVFTAMARVQSLFGELKSHKSSGQKKKKKQILSISLILKFYREETEIGKKKCLKRQKKKIFQEVITFFKWLLNTDI